MPEEVRPAARTPFGRHDRSWRERLDQVVEVMRELSRQTDANQMVTIYGRRMRSLVRLDATHSLSRRGLEYPHFRITRSTSWKEALDPWRDRERLPMLRGGLFAELLYGDVPRIIDPLEVPEDDPARAYLDGMGALIAIPHYEDGVGLNMVVHARTDHGGFDPEAFPDFVQSSNLFGRTTKNLVLTGQLRRANEALDRELKSVAEIQRALLPQAAPEIPTLEVAAHYQTSTVAGGDYYDFFRLADGRWGVLIADVSGHGAPAAVLMAIVHAIAHLMPGDPVPPDHVMAYVNRELVHRYTGPLGSFVTAFYGVYDEKTRRLSYACAGHPAPLIRLAGRCGPGSVMMLDTACAGIPLGIDPNAGYGRQEHQLTPGDVMMLFTDGIPEAFGPGGEMYGLERLTRVLEACHPGVDAARDAVVADVAEFCGDRAISDDRTMVIAEVR
ncbi:MAG: PP2C family protein-serine/threonine phosphatase [Phycisphaerales bacterium]|nr:PP2C family protein-serine/threonine phosphatase [Phycisphaerales bacterium]